MIFMLCVCVCVFVCVCVCERERERVCVCVCVCVQVGEAAEPCAPALQACMYACMHTRTHAYTRTHTHTHTGGRSSWAVRARRRFCGSMLAFYHGVQRDESLSLFLSQKRPILVSKEAYTSVKRGLY